ncbi:MAG: YitT family protein [Peptococcaceae bacterium]|nr:YitT family protein [Peptococcaceae bacterium]
MMKGFWRIAIDIVGITAGAFITALGLDLFLIPAKITAGGLSGLSTVLHYIVGVPVGLTMLALNIPLFLIAIYRLGARFGFRSLYGTLILSLFIDLMVPFLPVVTTDPLLSCLYGGVLVGLGLGLVFKSRGTTGGTDLAAAILRTYTGANVGQLLFLMDGAVVLLTGLAFRSWELALYSMITIFVSAWLIDLVQEGISYAKAFFIISNKSVEMTEALLYDLERGTTILRGKGGYSGEDKDVLLVVVNRAEVTKLKDLIHNIDKYAFVIQTKVHEVFGEGFKPLSLQESGIRSKKKNTL